MKVAIAGKTVSVSIQERDDGNCRAFFRWEGKQVPLKLAVRRKSDVRKADVLAAVAVWAAAARPRETEAKLPPTSFKVAMENHLRLAHADQAGTQPENSLRRLGEVLGFPDVDTITKEMYREAIPQLQIGLRGKIVKPKTWTNIGGEHKHFAQWLLDEDLIRKDFTRGVKLPGKRAFTVREDIFQEDWFEPIRAALAEEWRPVWEDAWFTGMDSKDLFDFRPAIHLQPMGPSGLKIWKRRSKSTIIIDQPLAASITPRWAARRQICGPEDPLHELMRRYPDSDSFGKAFLARVKIAERKCGLPQLQVKATRHTWLTRHLRRLVRREPGAPTILEIHRWGGWTAGSRIPEETYAKIVSESENPD